MRKMIVTISVIILVITGMGIGLIYFRGSNNVRMAKERQEESDQRKEEILNMASTPGQEGEPDNASKEFSKTLKEKAGITVEAKNIVPTGQPIISGKFAFTVTSWNISKESPGYDFPKGQDSKSLRGAELDANGNIKNEFSYVTVDISAENLTDEAVSEYIWAYIRLEIFNAGDYIGEVMYLGEETPRELTKDYLKESFTTGETKNMAMIYIAPDKILENQEMYMEINPSGAIIADQEQDVRRYIILN